MAQKSELTVVVNKICGELGIAKRNIHVEGEVVHFHLVNTMALMYSDPNAGKFPYIKGKGSKISMGMIYGIADRYGLIRDGFKPVPSDDGTFSLSFKLKNYRR